MYPVTVFRIASRSLTIGRPLCKAYTDRSRVLYRSLSVARPLCKTYIDKSRVPRLKPEELEERTTRGWGPGGQAVAKTSNAIFLKHTPTGIWVKCHQTRSLEQNRKIAKQKLILKLDNFLNGDDSIENQKSRIEKEKYDLKKEKTRLKYEERRKEKLGNDAIIDIKGEDVKDEDLKNDKKDVETEVVKPSETPV